jgi:hypothetical protein
MTDLQLGLLVIGAAAVGGVLLYNRRQERAARRAAERAFAAARGDVLLERGRRQEPRLGGAQTVDYVIELRLAHSMPAKLAEHWQALQQRFGRRAALAGADSAEPRAALQIVSRDGVVSEAELLEFRSQVEALGAALGAALSAPEMRAALEAARELDRICAEADIQVALHVVGPDVKRSAAGIAEGFEITERKDGLTLTLDVARSADPRRGFEAMARAARQLAAEGGRLVDDNGRVLDERAIAAIEAQLQAVRHTLVERGIEPGSALAQRLFS